ncbi:hypothetical protein DRE_01538 [Drechslerella stenobrocha 248]|uniref:DUF7165 domain-containing protein n=1 Tax=Drechslerella stenobrocha 248 TaxID=1043628 RepID=W7HIE2_9PEZI|nr:hypothetical protein DRE_01538 [Drechslerella stenobrocha 248]
MTAALPSTTTVDDGGAQKGWQEAARRGPPAFSRLPREIMQQILYFCCPNEFDSLTLINSSWYQASRSCLLYARQLAQCGVVTPKDAEDTPENLTSLVHQFSHASRRGLFESMLRPETTEVQLVCRSLSSSAAVPGGEVFKYEFSPRGSYLLAISSSRMVVIDTTSSDNELPVAIKRELKILRRPVSATILDDGSVMAVLSSEHKVNIYNLQSKKIKRSRSIDLDNAPRAIALAPDGSVLAVAYDGGVEVISLVAGFDQKRAVKCDLVDSLRFSLDGTVLIGSTLNSGSPATVVISAPFFSEVMVDAESLVQMWTTQILFPTTSRDISHATLLTHHGDNSSWTFTYDKAFAAFRAVHVDDLRNGHTYFAAPSVNPLPPTMLPAPSRDGGVVASGFGSRSVWIYGIPMDLESPGEGNGEASGSGTPARNSVHIGATFVPQWQHSVDRSRNNFVQGKKVADVPGLVGLAFSMTAKGERLIAVAAGIESDGGLGEEGMEALEGGRLVLFDFARSPRKGERRVISIDVGDGSNADLEQLEEQQNDMEAEVNIVRRRTVAQRQQRRSVIGGPVPSLPTGGSSTHTETTATSASTPSVSRQTSEVSRHDEDEEEGVSLSEAVEWSYSHTDTRSHTILQRAATAARANAERTPRRRAGADPGPNFSVTNYRLLGLREEEWIEPPPPYVENLTAIPLYDYDARLLERARSMGIMNPNERVRRRSSGSELDLERRDRDPLASGASSPRLRRNAPSLRITSPVSPAGGGLSRNGSVSAGPSTSFSFSAFSSQFVPEREPTGSASTGSASTPRPTTGASVSSHVTEVRPPSALSRRNSIQREPENGILSTGTSEQQRQSPSRRQPARPNPEHTQTAAPQPRPHVQANPQPQPQPQPQPLPVPQRAMASTFQQELPNLNQGRARHRDPESVPQRVFPDGRMAAIPPVPVIPIQFRSNSLPMQQEEALAPLQQRAQTERPQSAMFSPRTAAMFAQANGSIESLPNFEAGPPPQQTSQPQRAFQPVSSSPVPEQLPFPGPSPPRSQPSLRSDMPLRQSNHLHQPLLSRLPSHRYGRADERSASPALSVPPMPSASQPTTPTTPLMMQMTPSTAPVTPVTPRGNTNSPPRGMIPVSAMVAQPGPPPGSSGSNRSASSSGIGHPQFRTALTGGNTRNTLSLTVTPPPPQSSLLAVAGNSSGSNSSNNNNNRAQVTTNASLIPIAAGHVVHPSTTRSATIAKRSKSRSKRGRHEEGYVNPAFMAVPPVPHGPTSYTNPLPSPGRRVSGRRPPPHGGLYAAQNAGGMSSSSTSVNTLARNGSRAERSAARAASVKRAKKGWGRKGKENQNGVPATTRPGEIVAGGGAMDSGFEVVRRGSGNDGSSHGDKTGCAIM